MCPGGVGSAIPLGVSGSNLPARGVDPDMALPQSLQNLASSSFRTPQLVQYMVNLHHLKCRASGDPDSERDSREQQQQPYRDNTQPCAKGDPCPCPRIARSLQGSRYITRLQLTVNLGRVDDRYDSERDAAEDRDQYSLHQIVWYVCWKSGASHGSGRFWLNPADTWSRAGHGLATVLAEPGVVVVLRPAACAVHAVCPYDNVDQSVSHHP